MDINPLRQTMGISSVFIPNGRYIIPLVEKTLHTILWVGRSGRPKRPELFVELAKMGPQGFEPWTNGL